MEDLVLVKGKGSRLVWANRSFLDRYGMSLDQIRGIVDGEHVDPDDTVQYLKDDYRVLSTGQPVRVPNEPVTDTAGNIDYFETIKTALRTDDGQISFTVGVSRLLGESGARDRGERERSKRHESVNSLRLLIEHIPIATALFDMKMRFIATSRVWKELLCTTDSPLIGTYFDENVCGQEWLLHEIENSRESGKPLTSVDMDTILKGEHRAILNSTVEPWRDSTGEMGGVVVVLIDRTESHKMEDRLRQSQKLDAIGQLAGGIAHDFNNILTGIIGQISQLKWQAKELPEVSSIISTISRACMRAANLTNQLLKISRQSSNVVEHLDLHDILRREVTGLLSRCIDKKIEIVIDLRAERSVIEGDSSQIQAGILNLALNARDAMPNGGVMTFQTRNISIDKSSIEIDRFAGVKLGDYIELTVSDTGTGIEPAIQERIFEPFFTTKKVGAGTGLGLANVFRCALAHHGAVAVSSEVDVGSKFSMIIPVSNSQPAPSLPETRPADNSCSGSILVVDDEEMIRDFAFRTLTRLGCKVTLADGGNEALEHMKADITKFDLVFLDLIMPRMSGLDTLKEIKRLAPGTPIAITSGYAPPATIEDCMREGAVEFIEKPYTSELLAAAVYRILNATSKSE